MIIGVGTDIVEINRIERAIEKNERFLERLFTSREQEYFRTKKQNFSSVAANFAGKEAVVKVFGTGLRDMQWVDIEILRDRLGKPYVVLHERALKMAESLGIDEIQISLSHSKENAIAFAIGIKNS